MLNRFESAAIGDELAGSETRGSYPEINFDIKPRRDGCLIEFTGATDNGQYVDIARAVCDHLGFTLTPPEETDLVDSGTLELSSLSDGTLTLEIDQDARRMKILLNGGNGDHLQEAVEATMSDG